jgi:hypothetical protein
MSIREQRGEQVRMERRFARVLMVTAAGLTFALGAPGCTRSKPDAEPAIASAQAVGRPLFDFDSSQVQEILITRAAHDSGQTWSARFARASGSSADDWRIASAPDGATLLDRRANGGFIQHLLDTLRTLTWSEEAPHGPLESYGLARPQWSLRWSDGTHSYELQLGNLLSDHARVYAKDSGSDQVKVVRGAALKMLDYISSFDALRKRTLFTFPADDVDEFTVYREGSEIFYAQRLSDAWADRKNRPLPYEAGAYLEMLAHLRVEDFADDPKIAEAREKQVRSKPEVRVVMKDRGGHPTELRIARISAQGIWASLSSRPESAFRLYPEAWAKLRPARK